MRVQDWLLIYLHTQLIRFAQGFKFRLDPVVIIVYCNQKSTISGVNQVVYRNTWDALTSIIKTEGPLSLYKGIGIGLSLKYISDA